MKKKLFVVLMALMVVIVSFSACKVNPNNEPTSGNAKEESTNDVPQTQPKATTPESKPSETVPSTVPSTNPSTVAPDPETVGKKLIAVTFDDGPGKYTRNLIEELNKRGVKATFFMLGSNVAAFSDTVKFMYESGHELGTHTYSHKNIIKISNDEFRSEMQRTDDAIKAASGQIATAFRPPYGAYNAEKLALQDKIPTHWSVDTLDWKTKNPAAIKEHILTHARDGSILLLHDIYETSVQGVLPAIDELLAQGYQFVTVDKLVARNGDAITPHDIYFSCVPKQ